MREVSARGWRVFGKNVVLNILLLLVPNELSLFPWSYSRDLAVFVKSSSFQLTLGSLIKLACINQLNKEKEYPLDAARIYAPYSSKEREDLLCSDSELEIDMKQY